MNLDYIKSFHLIAHLRSVKEAAQKMQLSQPALSHQLQILEEEFGVQLVDRNTKPLQLTEPGNLLLSRCQELFDWIDEISSEMKSVQMEMEGKLRISTPSGIGNSWLMPRLIKFQEKYPKIDLHVELLDLSKVRDRLEQHRTDFIITIHQWHNPNLIFEPLFYEEMVLVCDKRHPMGKKNNWDFERIVRANWILYSEEDNSPQKWLEKRFGKKSSTVHQTVLVNDHACIIQMLKNAKHIAILPKHQVEKELDKEGFLIEILPSKEKAQLNQVYAGYRERKQLPKKIQILRGHLLAQ